MTCGVGAGYKALDEIEDSKSCFALALGAMLNEQLALENSVEALAHRVVIAITDRPHRRPHASFFAAVAERDRRILATLIGMMNDALRPATIDCHVERIKDQLRTQMRGHGPADDATTVNVEYDCNKQNAAPGWPSRRLERRGE